MSELDTANNQGGYSHKERNSNLELLRIIAMLAIVAHHSVVNSGITENYDFSNITANMVFLQLWGMWGKTAINAFVMITGYFMCTSKLTWKRFLKMWMEARFYKVVFFIIFCFAGYETITAKSVFKLVFSYISGVNNGFVSSFLVFYLFIPFMNAMIEKLSQKDLQKLIVLLLGMFTAASTFFFNSVVFHYVFWYMTLYFAAAYVRIYPNRWTESRRFNGTVLTVTMLLSYLTVVVVDFVGTKVGFTNTYYMVSDSNKLFAFIIGVSAFLFFKNTPIKNNRFVNVVASTTFGVLLIHANSAAMRQWLWKDLLHLPSLYTAAFPKLVAIYILVMLGVFTVCSLIDYIRIQVLEKPVFNIINRNTEKIERGFNRLSLTVSEFARSISANIKT